jgi:hypothetical protein
MDKTLTLKVPNELWVDNFSTNKTAQFTYSGPEKVWLTVDEQQTVTKQIYDIEPVTDKTKIEINIATATDAELAAVIGIKQSILGNHVYTYTDEINSDGSIYKRINNPLITDYYEFKYNTVSGIELVLITKETKTPQEEIAQERKAYVEKYTSAFEFEVADKEKINAFINAIDNYLNNMKAVYPWKHITIDSSLIPKIPVSLVTLFASLPPLK